jgi:ubiquinol-cytochrome c reductase iron-sulfur subunit
MTAEPAKPSRRDILLPLSLGAVAATLGLGLTALFRTGLPSETAPQTLTFDLTTLLEGEEVILPFERRPILIRHRSAEDIARAVADDGYDFIDLLAQNANLPASAPALDTNRRATPDGRFLVMDAVTPSDPSVVLSARTGDFPGWFTPCKGQQFDASGRLRKGPGWTNLAIPPLTVQGTTLTLLLKGTPRPARLDSMIWGDKASPPP